MKQTMQKLVELDKERKHIRHQYKKQMQNKAKEENKEFKIVFPQMHIGAENEPLTKGLPWIYNGFLIYLPRLVMLVDPGVDILNRLSISGINISQINTIYISHEHLDHSNGADVVADYLLRSGQRYQVIAPPSVFKAKVISDYHAGKKAHHSGWHNSHFATEFGSVGLIRTFHGKYKMVPIKLSHGAECYGFSIYYENRKITYISDTGYTSKFKTSSGEIIESGKEEYYGQLEYIISKNTEIKKAVKDSTDLIINLETITYHKNSNTHLTLYDIIDLVQNNNIKKVYLTHINEVGELGERQLEMKKLCEKEIKKYLS